MSGIAKNVSPIWEGRGMTSITYMIREDWGQHGTAMEAQSKVIGDWIGGAPFLFAVTNAENLGEASPADLELIEHLAPKASTRTVFDITELGHINKQVNSIDHSVVIVHPTDERDLECIRDAFESDLLERLFIMVWSSHDRILAWLDGRGAVNLHTGEARMAPDPLTVAAAKMLVSEEYNGLSSGRGKDAVVQLVRAFAAEGYAIDVDSWLCAYFAAGGSFMHSESVARLVREIRGGIKHRVKPRYREDILSVILERSVSRLGRQLDSK